MAALDLNISDKDATLIKDIITAMGIEGHRAVGLALDLSIVHANHAPLALRMMLACAQRQDLLNDVVHDLNGIVQNLDLHTGKLVGFYPRFTLGYHNSASNVNPETGIHYGYIKADSLHHDVVDHITFGIGKDLSYEEARKEEEKRLEARAEAIEEEVRIALAERGGFTESEYEAAWDKEVEAAYSREGYADREDFIEKQVEAFNQAYQCDEPIHEFEHEGVKGRTSWLGGALFVWVLDSPELGWYQRCSPCVPNAGNLDHPDDNGVLAYTVPKDWLREELTINTPKLAMNDTKLHLAQNDATVSMTRLFPSGMYLIELRDPSGDLVENVRMDDWDDAELEFDLLSKKAETL